MNDDDGLPMHVLYVDDDRINLLLFENACAAVPGLRLSTAASGAEAVEVARADAPQLLVIDLHLSDTDGHALLRTLRQDGQLPDVPAFLCSADDPAQLHRAALDAGFRACWAKPVDSQMLRRELAALGFSTGDAVLSGAASRAGPLDTAGHS